MKKSEELAARLGFTGMSFLNLSVAESIDSDRLPDSIDVVTALHACNTATDDAIHFALQKNAKYIVVVPCCQAEVASVLRKNKGHSLSKNVLTRSGGIRCIRANLGVRSRTCCVACSSNRTAIR